MYLSMYCIFQNLHNKLFVYSKMNNNVKLYSAEKKEKYVC